MPTWLARWLGAVLWLFSTGCVLSVQPVYFSEDLIFDPVLLGDWIPREPRSGAERAVLIRTDTLEYAVVYTDRDGQQGRFMGHLARVKGVLLFDMVPAPLGGIGNAAYQSQFVQTHLIVRIDRTGPTLQYRHLNADSLRRYFSTTPELHGWEGERARLILSSSTRDLQQLLTGHTLPDRVLWTSAIEIIRPASAPRHPPRPPTTK